MMLQIVIRS